MLTILSELVDAMVRQAQAEHPIETCGVIAGREGSDRPLRLIPMRNAAASSDMFMFDAREQLQIWREMDANGEEPVVIYHSHTASRAYPSKDDILCAAEPHAHYVIIPTDPEHGSDIRSFRIVNGAVVEETIKAVEHYSGEKPLPLSEDRSSHVNHHSYSNRSATADRRSEAY
ncbi:predicted metal-dependent protease of the PAD1/JAB1 superfamily [Hahella chejuensis KCTC 2396]|uniref:Predicted metal-dependent protease of the PAD1/JAB1 superfamily n=1 Tax=Hahella chejuensis (strain KCTC 2396) TaxID=349521 RepID=Q2SI97_HAHCH|nr:M67 family metallopeptidase [Hahella chejuensis]ABC29627.1 predicted metal-dependent protease of the PAD1/JAB1 superfamily [Hahella chejuensis KCTC 2396]